MKYAIWNLIEDTPNYLTGPEAKIVELGGSAHPTWANGAIEKGADILAYVEGNFDTDELAHWNYREITQEEALAFFQAINPEAYLLPDGKITTPME